ncbi:MAG: alanine--tRNA ligase-related protein, partial [Patescibacteria group bacterium]|nr:alanine--tRNA ligase-related protein [Patescibacteria group bacterium]
GKDAFHLYETYGFPIEITKEMTEEREFKIDIGEYEQAYKSHQEKSRKAAKGFFKGGMADTSDMSKKYHTATHLLLAALTQIMGDHISQKGSNINPERLRLDFPNERKLTQEELKKIENLVNEQIEMNLKITSEEMPKKQALKLVPNAMFTERYGDTVKVYFIGKKQSPFSTEICGGPHVKTTSELGKFKIIKHENVGSGIKRIKAILE